LEYTSGQIDAQWVEEIEADFRDWLERQPDVPFTLKDLECLANEKLW